MSGDSVSLNPQWFSVTIELTLAVPGPPGPNGARGEVGPVGAMPDVTTLALDAGYF
jgi:hypothetical protein